MHWMDLSGGGWLMMVLLWVVVIGAIILAARAFTGQRTGSGQQETALEILKKREFA